MAKDETTTEAPAKKEVTIAGVSFHLSTPYKEGHTLTAAEAKALNQTRVENIRNNKAKAVKDAAVNGEYPADVLKALAADVAQYDEEYEFTLSSGGGRVTDPLEKEAISTARALVTAAIKKQGKAVKDIDKEVLAAKIAEVAELPDVIAAAKKKLAERAKLAESVVDIKL